MSFTDKFWETEILPVLCELVKIESSSPDFDAEFLTNGQHDKVVKIVVAWLQKHLEGTGATVELLQEPRRTPFLLVTIPSFKGGKGTLAFYGHIDRQPPLTGWTRGGPYSPTYYDESGSKKLEAAGGAPPANAHFLYGRGTSDDLYALFQAVAAVLDVRRRGLPHGKIVLTIESAEESDHIVDGVSDLEFWLRKLQPALADLDTLVALDSGGPNFERLWLTSSLRGFGGVNVSVKVAEGDSHSGVAGGLVPDPQRIIRLLLSRLEDPVTGEILVPSLHPKEVPAEIIRNLANVPAPETSFVKGLEVPQMADAVKASLATTWKPSLTVTGISGSFDNSSDAFPSPADGGNVVRGGASCKFSIRIPPLVDAKQAERDVKELLSKDPPYKCQVVVKCEDFCPGWVMPKNPKWLDESLAKSSTTSFGQSYGVAGLGGSIPFVELLGSLFPKCSLLVTGVLGANGNNAHVRDEFLQIPFAKKIQSCINDLVADHAVAEH